MFTKFDIVWLLSEGSGGGKEIRTLPVLAYMKGIESLQPGIGAAISVILAVSILIFASLYIRYLLHENINNKRNSNAK